MSDPDTPQPSDDLPGATWSPRAYRILKIAVVVMGILLVVGFVLVVGTIASRLASPDAPEADAPVATAVPPDIAELLGPGTEIISTAVDSNRLALVVRRPDGISVIVLDLRNGQVVNVISGE